MGDDWRVTVGFGGPDDARKAVRAIRKRHVDEGVRSLFGGGVVVSGDGPAVFLYTDTKDAACAAERVVREVLVQHQIPADPFVLDWWDPDDQEWRDASIPLPESDDEQAAEHQDLAGDETLRDDEFEEPAAEEPRWEVIFDATPFAHFEVHQPGTGGASYLRIG